MIVLNPNIYSVVDQKRLHIGINEGYSGSINSYNNFITKTVAWIFRMSEKIVINGKTRHVNKESYAAWLRENTEHSSVQAKDIKNFSNVHSLQLFRPDKGLMRSALSTEKSTLLYHKFVTALTQGDFQRAKNYIGKGAEINGSFWVREGFGISHTTMKSDLPYKTLAMRASLQTPLIYSASRYNIELCNFLLRFQADISAIGEEVQFTRTITNVRTNASVNPTFHQTYGPHGRSTAHFGMNMHTTTTADFEEHSQKLHRTRFNPLSCSIDLIGQPEPVIIERYSRVQQASNTPLGGVSVHQGPRHCQIRPRHHGHSHGHSHSHRGRC